MRIGELFVDLDFKDGGALNKLTNFSIKFLALKNTAQQMGEVFDQAFGGVSRRVVEMSKLNDTMGYSEKRMEKWKALAEQNNVSFGALTSSIKALQDANAEIMMGNGNIEPFARLGIDMSQPREAFGLLSEIAGKIGAIQNIGVKRNLLSQMGISEEMLTMFKHPTGYFAETLQLTDKERDEVMALNKDWIALKQTVGMGWDKVLAGFADEARAVVRDVRGLFLDFANIDWSKGFSGFVENSKVLTRWEESIEKLTGKSDVLKNVFAGFDEVVARLKEKFQNIDTKDFAKNLVDGILGLGDKFNSTINSVESMAKGITDIATAIKAAYEWCQNLNKAWDESIFGKFFSGVKKVGSFLGEGIAKIDIARDDFVNRNIDKANKEILAEREKIARQYGMQSEQFQEHLQKYPQVKTKDDLMWYETMRKIARGEYLENLSNFGLDVANDDKEINNTFTHEKVQENNTFYKEKVNNNNFEKLIEKSVVNNETKTPVVSAVRDLNPANDMFTPFINQSMNTSNDNSSRTQNFNTNVTVNTTKAVNSSSGEEFGTSIAQQFGIAGYIYE